MARKSMHQYPEVALSQALEAIRQEHLPIREASRRYGVPRGTIQDRLHNRVAEGPRRMGPATVLTDEEEIKLVQWLMDLAKCGFARKKNDLLNTVQQIISSENRETPFKDNRPGNKWYLSFLRRHPGLSVRTVEGISKGRAVITEQSIRKWFKGLSDYLDEIGAKGILDDPRRILNGDETSFSMCPKTGKVLAPKGWRNVYDIQCGNEKETITVLLVFTANGETITPMVVFPYTRPPKDVVESVPEGWFLGRSETGWMKSDVFFEYVVNGVDKWLTGSNIPKPVLLLVDGHRTHLTLHLSKACAERQIILYCLPPNTTHILQPADVSVFKPLKSDWKNTVRQWQSMPENVNKSLSKKTFCPLLQKVLKSENLSLTIKRGFRKCGLYPFNPEAVEFSKCVQNNLELLKDKSSKPQGLTLEDFNTASKVIEEIKTFLEEQNQDVKIILASIYRGRESYSQASGSVKHCTENVEQLEDPVTEVHGSVDQDSAENPLEDHMQYIAPVTDVNIDPGIYEVRGTALVNVDHMLASTPSASLANVNPDANIQSARTSISSNSSVTPGTSVKRKLMFEDHLFYPEPLNKSGNKRQLKENPANDFARSPPKAVSSQAWREWLSHKEGIKKEKAEGIIRRKEERNRKAREKEENKRRSITDKTKNSTRSSSFEREAGDFQECGIGLIQCKECEEELVSDVEDDNLKNVGCDNCPNWFHLKCTTFEGLAYSDVVNKPFQCSFC